MPIVAASFVVQVTQEFFLVLGVALAGANTAALFVSRRRRKRYEADLAAWKAMPKDKKAKRGKRPEEPQRANVPSSIALVIVGLSVGLVSLASLTFEWIK